MSIIDINTELNEPGGKPHESLRNVYRDDILFGIASPQLYLNTILIE